MKCKAIICDLDGTLLNENHILSEYTLQIIKKIKKKGIDIYIATGRHHEEGFVIKKKLGLDSYLISSNGSRIHNEKNELIYSKNIPEKIVNKILNFNFDSEIHKNLFLNNKWYSEIKIEDLEGFCDETGFIQHIVPNFKNLNSEEIIKFFFLEKSGNKIFTLKNELEKILKNEVNFTLSSKTCLEIMNKDSSKGEAIKFICSQNGLKLSEIIAFGDGFNDLDMLSIVGKGYLMGNHHPDLKNFLPSHEVILSNKEDGVAIKLQELFLSNTN